MKLGNAAHCPTEKPLDNISVQILYTVQVLKTIMPSNQLNVSLMAGAADLLAPSPF